MADDALKQMSDQTISEVELIQAIQARVYDILTSGGEFANPSEDNFFCWVTPGIAVDEDYFKFAYEGFRGVANSRYNIDVDEATNKKHSDEDRAKMLKMMHDNAEKVMNSDMSPKTAEIKRKHEEELKLRAKAAADAKNEIKTEVHDLSLATKTVADLEAEKIEAQKRYDSAAKEYSDALDMYDEDSDTVKDAKNRRNNAEDELNAIKKKLKEAKSKLNELQATAESKQAVAGESATSDKVENSETSKNVETPTVSTSEAATTSGIQSTPLTSAEIEALCADDASFKYICAENFANLVDFVPDVTQRREDGKTALTVLYNEGSLSDRYKYALRMSQVMDYEVPADVQKKIDKFRKLLTQKEKKVDLITEEETTITTESELVKLYNEKMAKYTEALIEYNNIHKEALAGKDQAAVHEWALNGKAYYQKVKAAYNDWVNNGYKEEYEQISAYISQVMDRSMTMLKEEYKELLSQAALSGVATDFLYTTISPSNFAKSKGWSKFSFSKANYDSFDTEKVKNHSFHLGVDVKAKAYNLFRSASVNDKTSYDTEKNSQRNLASYNLNQFSLSFEVCQVQIVRPWFKSAFLSSKFWRFDENNLDCKGEMLSDGGTPPKGLLPAYPTSIIFVRNLELDFGSESALKMFTHQYENTDFSSHTDFSVAGFGVGGGILGSVSGSLDIKNNNSSSRDTNRSNMRQQGSKLYIDGMQIIGYNCHVLEKSPNPNPDITKWV